MAKKLRVASERKILAYSAEFVPMVGLPAKCAVGLEGRCRLPSNGGHGGFLSLTNQRRECSFLLLNGTGF